MAGITVFCFLASYTVALALEWLRLVRRTAGSRVVMLLFAAAGLLAHTLYLLHRVSQTHLPPLLSSGHDWLLVLAWIGVVLYLFLSTFDRNLAVGPFLLPLVLGLVGAAYFVGRSPNPVIREAPEVARRGWAMLHSALLVFGIAGVMLGLVLSLMYLVQHRRLKHKQTIRNGLTLPSLEKLARLNWWSVMVSVPLLTLGLAAGVILGFVSDRRGLPVTFTDPVVVGSLVAWGVMVAVFAWLAFSDRPAGKQIAWTTAWACGFLLLTLVALQILTGGGHAFLAPGPDPGSAQVEFAAKTQRSKDSQRLERGWNESVACSNQGIPAFHPS